MNMNRKSRQAVGIMMAGALVLGSLAGCGSKTESVEQPGTAAGETGSNVEMETVRVWTNDGSYKSVLGPIVEEYNKGQGLIDGINIDYKVFGSDYHDVLKVALTADQGPELYKFVGTVKEPFISAGWMVPIDDMPGGPEFLKDYEDILINGYTTFEGKTYSAPIKVLTTKFMYNKDLLKKSGITEAPETWDDVVSYAKKVTEDNHGEAYGYGVHLKDSASSGKWYFAAQFASSVGHMGYDFSSGQFRFADFTDNVEKILQMKADGSIFPGGEGMDNDTLMAQFAAGRIAMLPGVSWDVSNLDKFWKELGTGFELGVCDLPVVDPENPYKNYAQIADMLCLGSSAMKMPEKAMKVYDLLHGEQVQLEIQNNEVDFMARADIQAQMPAEFKKVGTKEFGDTSNSYFTMTPPDGMITVEGADYQSTLVNLISGPLDADVNAVLTDLDSRYNTALETAIKDGLDMGIYLDESWDTSAK